jgi:FkbM family methyltransferase
LESLNTEVLSFLEFNPLRIREGVLNPREIEMSQSSTVVIGLGNPEADIKYISQELQNLGFKIILPVEIAQYFFTNNINFENYWLSGDKQVFDRAKAEIKKAKSLFKEKKSQEIFEKILDYRQNSNLLCLPDLEPLESQYMPSDLPWVETKTPISIIDCGAFTGDTIQTFLNKDVIFENYFAFEPDLDNYQLLLEFVSKNSISNIFTLKLATWSESMMLKFQKSGGNNSGAHLVVESVGEIEKVFALKLDHMFTNEKIDLIKMDIEGAEKDTLIGLVDTIKKNKPYLAISAYHKPDDLWKIPLQIAEVSNEYQFFLRVYGQQTFDTVLYCVPSS